MDRVLTRHPILGPARPTGRARIRGRAPQTRCAADQANPALEAGGLRRDLAGDGADRPADGAARRCREPADRAAAIARAVAAVAAMAVAAMVAAVAVAAMAVAPAPATAPASAVAPAPLPAEAAISITAMAVTAVAITAVAAEAADRLPAGAAGLDHHRPVMGRVGGRDRLVHDLRRPHLDGAMADGELRRDHDPAADRLAMRPARHLPDLARRRHQHRFGDRAVLARDGVSDRSRRAYHHLLGDRAVDRRRDDVAVAVHAPPGERGRCQSREADDGRQNDRTNTHETLPEAAGRRCSGASSKALWSEGMPPPGQVQSKGLVRVRREGKLPRL